MSKRRTQNIDKIGLGGKSLCTRASIICVLSICMTLSSCSSTSSPPAPPAPEKSSQCRSGKGTNTKKSYNLLTDQADDEKSGSDRDRAEEKSSETPTWDDDILPLLRSVETGRVYKCTTCHSAYERYDVVADKDKIKKILGSIASNYMPLKNDDGTTDKMNAKDRKKLELWSEADFPRSKADVKDDPIHKNESDKGSDADESPPLAGEDDITRSWNKAEKWQNPAQKDDCD